MKTYNKAEAIEASTNFLKEFEELQEKYKLLLGTTDEGVFYISYRNEKDNLSNIELDNSEAILVVCEREFNELAKQIALAKLTDEEKKLLGL